MDATSHSLSILIGRVESDNLIVGPIIGDIIWYCDTWKPGRHVREQGNVQDVLDLASIADVLTSAPEVS